MDIFEDQICKINFQWNFKTPLEFWNIFKFSLKIKESLIYILILQYCNINYQALTLRQNIIEHSIGFCLDTFTYRKFLSILQIYWFKMNSILWIFRIFSISPNFPLLNFLISRWVSILTRRALIFISQLYNDIQRHSI